MSSPGELPGGADLTALLGALLADPKLPGILGSLLGGGASAGGESPEEASAEDAAPAADAAPTAGPPAGMDLSALLPLVTPLLQGLSAPLTSGETAPAMAAPSSGGEKKERDPRAALLLALRPYLSRPRRQAVDAFMQVSRMRDQLRPLAELLRPAAETGGEHV